MAVGAATFAESTNAGTSMGFEIRIVHLDMIEQTLLTQRPHHMDTPERAGVLAFASGTLRATLGYRFAGHPPHVLNCNMPDGTNRGTGYRETALP
jgi:hypothetical protein